MDAFMLAITLLWNHVDRGNMKVYASNLAILKKMLRLYHSDGNVQRILDDALAAAERHGADQDDLNLFREFHFERCLSVRELSERYYISSRHVYWRVNNVLSSFLMPFIFGIDGIEFS